MSVQEPNKVAGQPAVSFSAAAYDVVKKTIAVGTSYALSRFHWRNLRSETHQPLPVGTSLKTQKTIKDEVVKYITDAKKVEPQAQSSAAPLFTDELNCLKALVEKKWPQESADKKKVLDFANDVVAKSQAAPASPATPALGLTPAQLSARELLGQLIFLADKDLEKCAKLINRKNFDADKKALQLGFTVEMASLKSEVDAFVKQEAGFQICNESSLYAGMVPKVIAKNMVTSTGLINLGIAEGLKKALYLPGDVAQQKEMTKVLKDLEAKNARWTLLQETKAPVAKDAPARSLIIATLDLQLNHEVTDIDAKKAALSAHLTLLVQGNIGNCFADSVGKLIKKLHPGRFGTDMNVLLSESKLQRKVDGKEKAVDFVLNGNNSDLQNEIQIHKNGSFQAFYGTYYIWQSHGFAMAAKAMGIPQEKYVEVMTNAVAKIADKRAKFSTSAQEIILELAGGDQAKAQLGYFGFTSLRENPLLRAWENTLAEMAEMRPRSLVRSQILNCVKEVLMPQFQTQNIFQDVLMSTVFKQFLINLNNSITIEYSPNAKVQSSNKPSADGKSSSDGAFIIKSVKTGEEFQTLVVKAMTASFDSFASVAKVDSKAFLQTQVEKVNKVVMDKTFIGLAVSKFDPSNVAGKDPVALPWVAPYGDDPFEVMRVYFEEKQQVAAFLPNNAQTLFSTLLDYEVQRQQAAPNAKATRVILCSPQHAFEFTPNLPQFKDALEGVKSAGSIQAFMDKYQKAASDAWKTATLDSVSKANIVKWVAENLLPVKEIAVAFLDDVMSIDRRASLRKFHDELVARLESYLVGLEKADKAKVISSLDRYMLQNALPESVSKLIVPFANTNWNLETPNKPDEKIENPILRFCIYPDPIAQKVCFGVIDNKGKNLMAMNQDEWLGGPWEISLTTV